MNLWKRLRPAGDAPGIRTFGTFGGVFTPNVLTILGVIMYLRLGWVVGNAGLLGALIIILMAKGITICTGMSISSITTNIQIGAGGPFSIISKSLGLEAGGSIGIPLYIAQTLSAALYIIGFTEGWLRVFPEHPPWLISVSVWLLLLAISYISASFAIRIQYLVMTIMALSIMSFLLSPSPPVEHIVWIGAFEDADFWHVFAVFFPAVTGILAGANMSGDLTNPRRAIPIGTMSAIVVTMIIYLGLAFMCGYIGTSQELRTNQMFMVDHAWWGPVVIGGILGATFSSALGSMLGAPRLLQALSEHRIVPFHRVFAQKSRNNEPRNATMLTGLIIAAALMVELNTLASLITMFFLVTYGVINLVVFIQQSMRIISFRPTFKIPRLLSLGGAIGCALMMLLIDAMFSAVALVTIVALYIWLIRRQLAAEWGDIRGGMFLILAERASRIADTFPKHTISWKPDLLVPIEDPQVWAGPLFFIRSITYPSGSIFAFTITSEEQSAQKMAAMDDLLLPLKGHILVNSVVIEESDFFQGTKLVVQTLRGGSFRPNTLFLTISTNDKNDLLISQLASVATRYQMGMIILNQHARSAFGMHQHVNLWLRDKSPNWNLALLIGLHLHLNWGGKINLITATEDDSPEEYARLYDVLQSISDQARMPSMTELHVLTGSFYETLLTAPRADINIFGLSPDEVPIAFIRQVPELAKSSCVFVKDSGYESALA
ncbi:MAG: Na-K-Cl cotransporter [Chloroflexaceae bacterium]|nr:Na-K-Cl cotransporter [Chloroflexaceae bacterium]